jgi:hypothetical protein
LPPRGVNNTASWQLEADTGQSLSSSNRNDDFIDGTQLQLQLQEN